MNRTNRSRNSYLLILGILVSCIACNTPETDSSLPQLEAKLDSLIQATMADEHIPGTAYILIKDGKTLLKKGYGYRTIGEKNKLVNPDSTIFRIGSISKTFTATALLQLADRQQIDLNENVNNYLELVQVPTSFDEPVHAAHLLTHSAGFDELRGRLVFAKNQLIPLDTFLSTHLIRLRKPGVVSSYSTFGIALAGLLVEDISGLTLEEYMKENIWTPLGMNHTSIEIPENQRKNVALGYEYGQGANQPQPWEWYHTYPASSINSTVTDMAKYMQMFLNLGTLNHQTILSEERALSMQERQISIHPEVNGFANGLWDIEQFGMKTFNHGGDMAGFAAFMLLVPEENLGIFVVHHHEGTRLRSKVVSTILEHYGTTPQLDPNPERMNTDLSKYAGSYRYMTNCVNCPEGYQQPTYELKTNDDNTLSGFGRKFYQTEDLLFKSYDGKRIMGFRKNSEGEIQYMSLGNINAFEKIK